MDPATWTQVLRDVGYPAVFVLGTAFAWAAALRWIKPHAEGMIQDHRALVQATTESVKAGELAQAQTAREIEKLAVALQELAASQAQTARSIDAHDEWVREKAHEIREALEAQRRTG